MTFGDDIAAALPEMRAAAESLMVDTCVITDSGADAVWDADDGVWTTPEGTALYTGKCRVRQPAGGSTTESGESTFTVSDRIVSIPANAPVIPVEAKVLITTSAGDQGLLGEPLTVISPLSEQTNATARRLLCRKVDSRA